jgi:hypothetical protein
MNAVESSTMDKQPIFPEGGFGGKPPLPDKVRAVRNGLAMQ